MTNTDTLSSPATSSQGVRTTRIERLMAEVELAERTGTHGRKHGWRSFNRYIDNVARPHAEKIKAELHQELLMPLCDHHKIHLLRQRYACSFDVRLVALNIANKKCPIRRRVQASTLIRKAITLKVHAPSDEVVLACATEKPSGGFRQIVKPGLEHRARQGIVKTLLAPFRRPLPNQFAARGNGGYNAAIEHVRAALQAGYVFTCRLDIRNAFPSCTAEQVHRLLGQHIHRGVIDHDIMASGIRMILSTTNHSPEKSSLAYALKDDEHYPSAGRYLQRLREEQGELFYRDAPYTGDIHLGDVNAPPNRPVLVTSGMPQGFASSAAVFELIVTDILMACQFSETVIVINFADDFLFMARSEQELREAINMLQSVLRRSRYDSLRLNTTEYRRAGEEIKFLGYSIQMVEENVDITLNEEHWNKFRQNGRKVMIASLKIREPDAIRTVSQFLNCFVRAKHLARRVREDAIFYLDNVRDDLCTEAAMTLDENEVTSIIAKFNRIPTARYLSELHQDGSYTWTPPAKRHKRWKSSKHRRSNQAQQDQTSTDVTEQPSPA